MDRDVLPRLGERSDAPFHGRDIVSVKQFGRDDLSYVFQVAHEMRTVVSLVGSIDLLKGRVLANVFFEPSTRTSSSFAAAMQRLGGSVLQISSVRYSSVAKGETLSDTIRTLESYADVVVLRHPKIGAADEAAAAGRKPLINAGDGAGEHPTQALLDIFTMKEEMGQLDGLTVTVVGDLKYGRTVHSLSRLLALYDVKLNFVAPPEVALPDSIVADLTAAGAEFRLLEDLDEVLADTDVLYVTRVQKERFEDLDAYARVAQAYTITPALMERAKQDMIVMHPFPRVTEIDTAFDDDPRAAYFRQIEYGLFVRMALLAMVLGRA